MKQSTINNYKFVNNFSSGQIGVLALFYNGYLGIVDSIFRNNTSFGTAAIYGSFQTSENILGLVNVKFQGNQGRNMLYLNSWVLRTHFVSVNCEFSNFNLTNLILSSIVWIDNNSDFNYNYQAILAVSESDINLFSTSFHNNIGSKSGIVDISFSSLSCTKGYFYRNFITLSLYLCFPLLNLSRVILKITIHQIGQL